MNQKVIHCKGLDRSRLHYELNSGWRIKFAYCISNGGTSVVEYVLERE